MTRGSLHKTNRQVRTKTDDPLESTVLYYTFKGLKPLQGQFESFAYNLHLRSVAYNAQVDINLHNGCNLETHLILQNNVELHVIRIEAEEFTSLFIPLATTVAKFQKSERWAGYRVI